MSEEIILTRIIGNIIKDSGYKIMAYNICRDHVHLLPVCYPKELTSIVQKIKSMSSRLFHRSGKIISYDPANHKNHLWSQKFYRAYLDDWELARLSNRPGEIYNSSHLQNTFRYIRRNRIKHELPISAELDRIIAGFVVRMDEAFHPTGHVPLE